MDKEQIKKWLIAIGNENKITRCKLECSIYSDLKVSDTEKVKLKNIEISLLNILDTKNVNKKNGFYLTLKCVAIIITDDIDYAVELLEHNLVSFFVLSNSNFLIKYPIYKQVECDKKWVGLPAIHMEGISYKEIEKNYIKINSSNFQILNDSLNSNKELLTKIKKSLYFLKTAKQLENLWIADSFLNYYKCIEMAADELKKDVYKKYYLNTPLIQELNYLLGDYTQKLKVYFLHKILELTEFDIKKIIKLAEIRNELAHSSSYQPSHTELNLCRCYSLRVFSSFLNIGIQVHHDSTR